MERLLSRSIPSAVAAVFEEPSYFLRKRGEGWQLRFAGRETQWLRPAIGYSYLREILKFPHKRFKVSELLVAVQGERAALPLGDSGDLLDAAAKRAYLQRLQELTADIEEAQENHDIGTLDRLQIERDQLLSQITQAGFRTHATRCNSDLNSVRNSVCNAIRRSLRAIEKYEPAAFDHLTKSIWLGFAVAYHPNEEIPWAF